MRQKTPEYKGKRAQHMRLYYANLTPEQLAERKRKAAVWRKDNASHAAKQRQWKENNAEHHKYAQRRYCLIKKYGITPEQFDALFASQGSVCAICRTDKPMGTHNIWHMDHCHKTGAPRGILCFKCNVGLGKFNDDPSLLIAALNYLSPEFHR